MGVENSRQSRGLNADAFLLCLPVLLTHGTLSPLQAQASGLGMPVAFSPCPGSFPLPFHPGLPASRQPGLSFLLPFHSLKALPAPRPLPALPPLGQNPGPSRRIQPLRATLCGAPETQKMLTDDLHVLLKEPQLGLLGVR